MKTYKNYIISGLIIILIISAIWFFSNIVVYILIAYIISLLGSPINRILNKIRIGKIKIPNGLVAFITLVSVWIIFFTFFKIFIPIIANEAKILSQISPNHLVEVFKEPIQSLENIFYKLNNTDTSLSVYLQQKAQNLFSLNFFSNSVMSVGNIFTNMIIGSFAVSFFAFFFIKDSYLFYRMILLIVPDQYDSRVKYAMIKSQRLLSRYFIGLFIEVLLVATLITIGMLIIGIEFQHAIVIGIFAGLLNVIPYVGPIIGAFFGIIIATAVNINLDFYTELIPLIGYTTIVFTIVQLSDNIIFQPLIYSNSVNAHPMEIFIVILAAGSMAGILGMILAVPVYTIFRIFGATFLTNFKIINSLTKNLD
jgi:predicted PurR-regulated permease PerM